MQANVSRKITSAVNPKTLSFIHSMSVRDVTRRSGSSESTSTSIIARVSPTYHLPTQRGWTPSWERSHSSRIPSLISTVPVASSEYVCTSDVGLGGNTATPALTSRRWSSLLAPKASNQAMELTATRRASTLHVTRTSPLRTTLALGGRPSSCSR
jgi:hypothetical protein